MADTAGCEGCKVKIRWTCTDIKCNLPSFFSLYLKVRFYILERFYLSHQKIQCSQLRAKITSQDASWHLYNTESTVTLHSIREDSEIYSPKIDNVWQLINSHCRYMECTYPLVLLPHQYGSKISGHRATLTCFSLYYSCLGVKFLVCCNCVRYHIMLSCL